MKWPDRKSVVVPLDLSRDSLSAIDVAAQLVESPDALHTIHVLPPLSAVEPGVAWGAITEQTAMENSARVVQEQLEEAGHGGLETEIRFGNPAHAITEYAKEIDADLIVIPSHGRTGIKHLLIGSVAERVVRHAHCPVLVLRR